MIGFVLSVLQGPSGCELCEDGFSALFNPSDVLVNENFPSLNNVCV